MQKQVLSLYRSFLRAARIKPPESRKDIESFVGAEFRKYAQMDKKEFQSIEFLLRRGNKQLEMLKSPGVSGFSYVAPKGMQALRCDAESAAWFSCVEAGYCNWLQLCFFPPSMNSCFVYTLDQCIGNSFHLVISNALIQGVSEN